VARARNPSSALFTLAAIVVAVAALYLAKEIFLPLALAILISFLLTPLADRLERWRVGRIPSVIAVVGVAFLVLGGLGWIVASQLIDLSENLPAYRENVVLKIRQAMPKSSVLDRMSETYEEVKEELVDDESVDPKATDAASPQALRVDEDESSAVRRWFAWADGPSREDKQAPVDVRVVGMPLSPLAQVRDWLGPMVSPITTAGVAVVLVLFMLIQREDQRNRLLQLFGGANLHATTEALTDVTERVSRYLRMQFLINASYGLSVGLGLWAIGLPNGVMWGVLSFSLRFLPYIGPWLSAIMPLAISIAVFPGWTQPLLVVAWFLVLELIVNNVAEPLLYGRSVGISGVGVIVAAIFWTWLWGAIGLVLAMPLTVCLVVLARYVPGLHFLTVLLGDQPSMTDEERIYQRLLAGDVEEAKEVSIAALASKSLSALYDDTLIPALRLAEQDRHGGLLSADQEEMVHLTAHDLLEELDELEDSEETTRQPRERSDSPPFRVLCIPLRDDADEISAMMIKRLLARDGIATELAPSGALTGELVEKVESCRFDVVVIAIVPPLPPRNSRLLVRRLRERCPKLSILLGCFSGACSKEMQDRLATPGDAEVLPSVSAVAERVRAIAGRGPLTPSDVEPDVPVEQGSGHST
jgi:predicted PurR-regulated permease PerM